MSVPDVDHLRWLVEKTLGQLGMPDADWCCIRAKSTDEDRLAHRELQGGVLAVWLTDRNEIEFHGENGDLLATVPHHEESAELVGAA